MEKDFEEVEEQKMMLDSFDGRIIDGEVEVFDGDWGWWRFYDGFV